jgi:tRNA(His) 5'-end guanylyltransferase
MKNSPLRQRIREYEDAYRIKFPRRMPLLIRVDGRAFHSFCSGMERPWDPTFVKAMNHVAKTLVTEISGAKIAYVQSDEITILLIDYNRYVSQPWFDKGLQKLVSISASISTMAFNQWMSHYTDHPRKKMQWYGNKTNATFDSRAFVIPREDVCNAFIDRQRDCMRNAILSTGQEKIGRKKINGLDTLQILKILKDEHGITWRKDINNHFRNGRIVIKKDNAWIIPEETPIFGKERYVVDNLVWPEEEEGAYSSCLLKEDTE